MVTPSENELMTGVVGDAPLGKLMREHYWVPFALSSNLVAGDAPTAVRLLGEDFVAFRAEDGRVGFFDELCPHRRASLLLARTEGNGLRCIYHGWKMDVSGCVVECPTQAERPERFAAGVRFAHFPVHETGGIAWVWLGSGEVPPFPDLPFNDEHGLDTELTFSVVSANWLQGLEGGMDSVHGTILHESVIDAIFEERGDSRDLAGLRATVAAVPRYETEEAPFGMRQASLRPVDDGRTYARVAHLFFPFVVLVPTGNIGATQIFCLAPVDDEHHLLVFGNYGEATLSKHQTAGARPGFMADPRNFVAVEGNRFTRWGQDRELMKNGHWSGFERSAIDEDAVVQISMGPIADRTKENLSSSDLGIAQTRRLILDAIAAVEAGGLPPGSVHTPNEVRVPHPLDAMLDASESWRDL